MNLRTILSYQLGQRAAIQQAADNRSTIIVGAVLVFITAIARNYDQRSFLTEPWVLFGPLAFSICSGTFLFLVLKAFTRRHLETSATTAAEGQWTTFMGLFWMTAPVAWLYAIPVERFLEPYAAAQANLSLLAIVSFWRVLLMARVISLVLRVSYRRAFAWVLFAATLEVLVVLFIGMFTSGAFSRAIMRGMGGLRNAPEEDLILNALSNVWFGAAAVFVVTSIGLMNRRFNGTVKPLAKANVGRVRWGALLALLLVWIAIAIPAQVEQHNFEVQARLIRNNDYRDAIDFMSHRMAEDFPASRRLEPNPYEYQGLEQLPGVIAVLKPTDAKWVQKRYLDYIATLSRHYYPDIEVTNLLEMVRGISRLPDGRSWVKTNEAAMIKLSECTHRSNPTITENEAGIALTNELRQLGIDLTETNRSAISR